MKSLAFIDNFVESPVIHGVNDYILHSQLPCTYHMPGKFGMGSLHSLKKYDGLVLLGSASHVTEKLPWHEQLLEFVIPKLESGTPVLGICFGHQLLAHYYKCEVEYASLDKVKFQQARSIEFTANEMGFCTHEKITLGNSHSQIVKTLSPEIQSFAKSENFQNEAIKHIKYPMWAFQAHPEASQNFLTKDAKIEDQKLINKIIVDGFRLIDQFVAML